MDPYISLVTLAVADIERSVRFYRDGLGWRMSAAGGANVAFFQCGAIVLALYQDRDFAADLGVGVGHDGPPRHTFAHNVRDRALVDDAMRQARAAGATIMKEPVETTWGYVGYFADPDGHPWEVAWNPGFPLSENGGVTLPR